MASARVTGSALPSGPWMRMTASVIERHSASNSSGIPMSSPMTIDGNNAANSAMRSQLPRSAKRAVSDDAISRRRGSSWATRRGVKARERLARRSLCNGGSMSLMIGRRIFASAVTAE